MQRGRPKAGAPDREPTRYLTVRRFPVRLLDALNVAAEARGITAAEIVRTAVAKELGLPAEAPPADGEQGPAAPAAAGGARKAGRAGRSRRMQDQPSAAAPLGRPAPAVGATFEHRTARRPDGSPVLCRVVEIAGDTVRYARLDARGAPGARRYRHPADALGEIVGRWMEGR